MTEEEKKIEQDQYRFSGNQLPMVQLDETGPAYVVVEPHPDYRKPSPLWWARKDTWEAI